MCVARPSRQVAPEVDIHRKSSITTPGTSIILYMADVKGFTIKNEEEAWFVGSLVRHSLITCSDYVFKSVNLLYLPNAEVSCINGLSAVCQGKLTLCNDQLINSQIAPLKCVPVIKSPCHIPAPPSTLHHLLPTLCHHSSQFLSH